MIIKKSFNKAAFIDNPYKGKFYIDMNIKHISVYEKIEIKGFLSFLDKHKNNKYNFIGSQIYEFNDSYLKDIHKLKKEVFESTIEFNYFKLSNLNHLNKIIDDLCSYDILRKDDFLNFLYQYDLDIDKLSALFKEKCNISFSKKLEHSKEMKLACINGALSGSFLKKELYIAKEQVKKIRIIVDEIIERKC